MKNGRSEIKQGSTDGAKSDRIVCQDLDRRDFLKNAAIFGTTAIAITSSAQVFAVDKNTNNTLKSSTAGDGKEISANKKLPPVRIPDVSILMRSPDSYLVGVTTSDVIEIKLADVLKLHGYCAGGVAFSFRAAQEAFKVLYVDKLPLRQSIKVHTSIHCCQADALAYITGARTDFGALPNRADLVLIPEEKKQLVFIDKITGKQVTLKPLFNPHDIFSPLFMRVRKDPSFAPHVQKVMNEKIQEYIYGPREKLFQIVQV